MKMNEVGSKLLWHFAKRGGNTVISPLSIYVSMSMVLTGTTNSSMSEKELAEVLVPKLLKNDTGSFKVVMEHIFETIAAKDSQGAAMADDSVRMKVANLLYVVQSVK